VPYQVKNILYIYPFWVLTTHPYLHLNLGLAFRGCHCGLQGHWRIIPWFYSFKISSDNDLKCCHFESLRFISFQKRFLDSWNEFHKIGISEFDSVAESWYPGFGDDRQLVTQNWEIEMVSRDNHSAAAVPLTRGSLHKLMILKKIVFKIAIGPSMSFYPDFI
jgi:hypothetical protein